MKSKIAVSIISSSRGPLSYGGEAVNFWQYSLSVSHLSRQQIFLNTIWTFKIMIICAIWYHLYCLKNVKNTHGGVLLLLKLQTKSLQLY